MSRVLLVLAMAAVLLTLWADAASAQGFVSATAAVIGNGHLLVSFVLEGLRPGEAVTVQAQVSDARGVYVCQKAANGAAQEVGRREEVAALIGASTQLRVNATGGAAGTITLSPPRPTLRCGAGEALLLMAVSYSTVDLRANGLTAAASGSALSVLIEVIDPVLPTAGS